MKIKKCQITTNRFVIEVIATSLTKQFAVVKLLDGTHIIYLLKIEDGRACWTQGFFSSKLEKSKPEYKCQEFYDYIKGEVEEVLKFYEYWEKLSVEEISEIYNREPFLL